MPAVSEPPNRVAIAGPDGRPSSYWQQWFTALYRTVVPRQFFYIPTSGGAPTATPETRPGFVAVCYDTANNRLYVYNGAWVKVTLS